ncbi:MAG: CHAT domain-containing protein [Calothrix sp. SM1_7_51]|nr:CHAT domain-containing protein [Calothrix sp. SM1_7_51]
MATARYVAFILPANQPDAIRMIDIGTAEPIDDLIFRFRLQASDNSNNQSVQGLSKKATQLRKLRQVFYNSTPAIQLSQAIIRPIREFTTQSKHLILAPDGNLNLVPFQILPTDENGAIALLMDDWTISYLSVGRDILRSKEKISQPSTPLIIADPDFDLVSEDSDTAWTIAENIKAELLSTLASDKLKRAIGTKYLGESIARKLKNARLYTGKAALETLLITNHCPAIILIATHGIFIPDSTKQSLNNNLDVAIQNPMMRSGLAFAGANTWLAGGSIPKQAGKGFALAQEIATLDLRANEITVLSACDTARGDIKIGEGVFGLRRAFAVAGAKTLIMSLWSVPDKATALLMERFFDNLQLGMGRGEALQHAQNYLCNITVNELEQATLGLEVLAERLKLNKLSPETKIDCREDDTPLQHPFYWGAWICQGDTAAICCDTL